MSTTSVGRSLTKLCVMSSDMNAVGGLVVVAVVISVVVAGRERVAEK